MRGGKPLLIFLFHDRGDDVYINNFMYEMSLNDEGQLPVVIKIPKEMQGKPLEEIEIRLTEKDIRGMAHVFRMAGMSRYHKEGDEVKITDGFAHIGETAIIEKVSMVSPVSYRLKGLNGWWQHSQVKKVESNEQ